MPGKIKNSFLSFNVVLPNKGITGNNFSLKTVQIDLSVQ